MSCGGGITNSYESLTDNWTLLGLEDEDVAAIAVSKQDRNLIFAGSEINFNNDTRGKLFRSRNSGADWDTLLYGVIVTDIKFDINNSNVIYVSLYGSSTTPLGIIKSTDGGATWATKVEGLPPLNGFRLVFQLAIDPSNPHIIYACIGGFNGRSLYKSTNGGDSWVEISRKVPDASSTSVEIDPSNPNIIYLGTMGIGGVSKSIDAGYNWEKTSLWEVGGISDIAIDPNDHSRLVVSGNLHGSATFISADGGVTWNLLGDSLTGASIVIDEAHSNIYTGSGFGIFKYDEGLHNWVEFNEGLNEGLDNTLTRVRALEYIGSLEIMLAGTGKGIYGRKLNVNE